MKNKTHKLLEDAHSIVINATGIDITKKEKSDAYKKVRAIYKQIKDIDPQIFKILNEDDNHKSKTNG